MLFLILTLLKNCVFICEKGISNIFGLDHCNIPLLFKSMDWFLYDNGHRHERVKLLATYFCPNKILKVWKLNIITAKKKVKKKVPINLIPTKPIFFVKSITRTCINFSKIKAKITSKIRKWYHHAKCWSFKNQSFCYIHLWAALSIFSTVLQLLLLVLNLAE